MRENKSLVSLDELQVLCKYLASLDGLWALYRRLASLEHKCSHPERVSSFSIDAFSIDGWLLCPIILSIGFPVTTDASS